MPGEWRILPPSARTCRSGWVPPRGARTSLGGAAGHHDHGLALEHALCTNLADGLEDAPPALTVDRFDGHLGADRLADPHRRQELQGLAEIDTARPGQLGAEYRRDQAGREHAVRDPAGERRP